MCAPSVMLSPGSCILGTEPGGRGGRRGRLRAAYSSPVCRGRGATVCALTVCALTVCSLTVCAHCGGCNSPDTSLLHFCHDTSANAKAKPTSRLYIAIRHRLEQ